jgi:fatty acid desaturase
MTNRGAEVRTPDAVIPATYYERSMPYAYGQTLAPMLLLAGLLTVARSATSLVSIVVLVILIGLVQYRLYFPLHDCSHMSLFAKRGQNVFWGQILAGLLFTVYDSFRGEHMKHHKTYGTRDDPGAIDYWVHFRSRADMIRFLLVPLWGGSLLAKLKDNYGFLVNSERETTAAAAGSGSGPRSTLKLALLGIPLILQAVLCVYVTRGFAQPWRYAVFIVVPAVTIFLFMSRLRMFVEHGSMDYERFDYLQNPRVTARTIPSRFPERTLLCGMNFNYHYEHHLFPAVPSCQLKRVHKDVTRATIQPEDFARTYLEAVVGLWRKLGSSPSRPRIA